MCKCCGDESNDEEEEEEEEEENNNDTSNETKEFTIKQVDKKTEKNKSKREMRDLVKRVMNGSASSGNSNYDNLLKTSDLQ